MRLSMAVLTAMLTCACATTGVESQTSDVAGKVVFDTHCAECHAPGIGRPGTQQLGWTRGEQFAVLENRTDLFADYVKAIVRNGLLEMPPFFPSELPDSDLDRLARYLSNQ